MTMVFEVETMDGFLAADGLDEHAPAVKLQERGSRVIEPGTCKPVALKPGETTHVVYPLIGRELHCIVRRVE